MNPIEDIKLLDNQIRQLEQSMQIPKDNCTVVADLNEVVIHQIRELQIERMFVKSQLVNQ